MLYLGDSRFLCRTIYCDLCISLINHPKQHVQQLISYIRYNKSVFGNAVCAQSKLWYSKGLSPCQTLRPLAPWLVLVVLCVMRVCEFHSSYAIDKRHPPCSNALCTPTGLIATYRFTTLYAPSSAPTTPPQHPHIQPHREHILHPASCILHPASGIRHPACTWQHAVPHTNLARCRTSIRIY